MANATHSDLHQHLTRARCRSRQLRDDLDRDTVVDAGGRVIGVDGLAVVDASVIPWVPRANTNLASIMIGEKVGEWLRTNPSRYGL